MTTDGVDRAARVVRARAGDRAAFDLLAASVVDRLFAIARLVLRDTDLAEDAVQETLVRCTTAELSTKIEALEQFVELYDELATDLRALDAPPALRDEHSANVARFEDVRAILIQIVALLREEKIAEAEALDRATSGITARIGTFETQHSLVPCP
jgi:hypothetical protein